MNQPAIRLSRPQLFTLYDVSKRHRDNHATWRYDMRVLRAMEKRGLLFPLPDVVPAPGPDREDLLFRATRVTEFGRKCLVLAKWVYETDYFGEVA